MDVRPSHGKNHNDKRREKFKKTYVNMNKRLTYELLASAPDLYSKRIKCQV